MKEMKRFKFKFYMLLTALILLTMMISLSFSYFFSYDSQLKQLKSQMRQTVEDKTVYMGEWLNGKVAVMEVLHVPENDQPNVSAELMNRYGISDVYEGYADGTFKSFTGWIPPAGYDPRNRPWYKTILLKNSLAISDPYLDLNSNQMTISVGRPILQEGKVIGIRATDILIPTIIEEASRLDFSDIGFVWIINERGNFIYHPDSNIIYKNISQVEGITGIPDYAALVDGGEVRYVYKNSKRTALFRKIPNSEWLLGVTIMEDKAFQNLENLRSLYLAISIVLTCIFGATSYVITRILAAPIVKIIGFVEGISKGDLEQKLEIRFNKEVDALAASLNEMALTLKNSFMQIESQKQALSIYNTELEALVMERTMALEETNLQLKSSYEAMEKLASTDCLTGITNRRYFFEVAALEVSRSDRDRQPFCLLIADLDDFKHVNDQYSHAAGDVVLIEATKHMKANLRSYDMLGRLGGEEFIMLLPETTEEQGKVIAERIRKDIENTLVNYENHAIRVTVSLGLTIRDSASLSLEEAVAQADEALYTAKATGKNKVALYTKRYSK